MYVRTRRYTFVQVEMGCWAGLDWARLGVFFLNYARCLFVGAALRMERGVNNNSLVGWLGGGAGDTLGGDGSGMWPLGCVAMPMGLREQLFAGWLAGWRAAGAMLFSRGLIPGGASYHNSFLASRVARRSTAGKCLAGFLGESPVQDAWDCSMGVISPYFTPGRKYWRPSVKGVSASMLWGACGRVDPFNVELVSFTALGIRLGGCFVHD